MQVKHRTFEHHASDVFAHHSVGNAQRFGDVLVGSALDNRHDECIGRFGRLSLQEFIDLAQSLNDQGLPLRRRCVEPRLIG